jgi:CSLREA domain-containing protein
MSEQGCAHASSSSVAPARRRRAGRASVAILAAVLCSGAVLARTAASGAATTAARPALRLVVARHAGSGGLSIEVVVSGVPDLGGVQGSLRFDPHALEVVRARTVGSFVGLQADDLSGPSSRLTFASFGHVDATAATPVETVEAVALAAGSIELRVDGLVLVTADGSRVTAPTAATTSVTVVRGTSTWRAPRGADATVRPRAVKADADHDGTVTSADVQDVAMAWTLGNRVDTACAAPQPGTDVDGDGCVTVADLAATASRVTAVRHVATPRNLTASGTTVFTVDTTSDASDTNPGDGTCAIAGGGCSLRAAIQEANAAPGAAEIDFNIAPGAQQTIQINSVLPTFTNPNGITIDGTTQPGSVVNTAVIGDSVADNAVYGIVLHGGGMATGKYDGFNLASSNNVIRGLDIYGFFDDVFIDGSTAAVSNNTVAGNLLGLDPNGNFDPSFSQLPHLGNGSTCVVIRSDPSFGANHNTVGGPNAADRNVISGCGHDGIGTYVWGSNFNTIQNNVIGLDPSGTQARGSISHGVDLNTGSTHNVTTGNLISGNRQDGVEISHNPATQYDTVTNNFVGTDPTGNAAPAYAGNGQYGLHAEGYPDCSVAANPSAPLCPPDVNHLTMSNNVVVGSTSGGILVDKGVHDSTFDHNLVGITPNGTPGPNHLFGVNIQAGSFNITFGPGNEVADNDGGVNIEADGLEPPDATETPTNDNRITQNSIHDNNATGTRALGIDLKPFGSTNAPPGGDPNVNEGIVPPVFGVVSGSAISVMTCAGCVVEVFLADQPGGASGSGETYLASATADGSGAATVALPSNASGKFITATATKLLDPAQPNGPGSTSEFAKNVSVGTLSNAAPIAKFTPSCSHFTCTFDGSASIDPDGTVASYSWSFGDGTNGVGVSPSHTYSTTGTFTVTLTVTDNQGLASTPVSHNVSAANAAPIAAISIIGPASGACNGTICDFDGSGSHDPDPTDTIVSYVWDFGDGTAGSSATKPAHTFAAAGLYVVTLTVTDNHGATGTIGHTIEINQVGSQGTGAFSLGPTYAVTSSFRTISGDFNGDGKTDIFWYSPSGPDYIWLANSTGTGFVAGPHVSIGGNYIPIAGDFNGDGKTDIMWYAPGSAPDYVWLSTGSGFIAGPHINITGVFKPIPGDFNGDHKTDILWYAPGAGADVVWLSTGTGFVGGPKVNITGSFVPIPGDFNGDHKTDIVWYGPGSAPDAVWYANAAGNGFVGGAHLAINGSFTPVVGDYNSDGFDDIFWLGANTMPDYLWRGCIMNSQCPLGFRAGPGVSKNGTPIGIVGNFNGLGNADILWYTPGTTSDPMWFGLG